VSHITSFDARPDRVVRRFGRLLALAAVLCATPLVAHAQGRIQGVVRDSAGARIVGAEIRLAGSSQATVTDDKGAFDFAGVPAGTARLSVRRLGFAPGSFDVQVHDGATTPVAITVREVALELSSVVVHASREHKYTGYLAGFYQRRDRGFGHFLTGDEINRTHPLELTDVLRTVPGISVTSGPYGVTHVRLRGNTCWPVVVLDGMPAVAGEFDLDDITPTDVAGIEVYGGAAAVPAEFVVPFGPTACGTIVVWTEHPEPAGRHTEPVTPAQLDSLVASLTVFTADQVDSPARTDPASPVSPAYPDSLFRARVAGHVIAEFIVDANGHAREGTIGVVSSTDPLFTIAVRQAIAAAHFVPARRHGARSRRSCDSPSTSSSPPTSSAAASSGRQFGAERTTGRSSAAPARRVLPLPLFLHAGYSPSALLTLMRPLPKYGSVPGWPRSTADCSMAALICAG